MTYRVLDVNEWPRLKPIFDSYNSPLPDPRFAMIIGALDEEKNEIQGFIVSQLMFHAEPMWVNNPHVVKGLINKMETELVSRMGGPVQYYAVVPDPRVGELCGALGLKKMESQVFHKQL